MAGPKSVLEMVVVCLFADTFTYVSNCYRKKRKQLLSSGDVE